MKHGLIEVFAYQETLLIMAVFGIAILAMIWVGFRRWLQSRERAHQLLSEQAAQFGALVERVEARLNAIEHIVTDERTQAAARIESHANPAIGPISKANQLKDNP